MKGLGLFNLSVALAHPIVPVPLPLAHLGRTIVAVGRVAQGSTGGGSSTAAELQKRIGEHSYYCIGQGFCTPTSPFLGGELNLDTIAMTAITMVVILILALLVRSRLSVDRPRGVQNVLEFAFEFVNNQVAETLGAGRVSTIGPLAVALFLFILLSNWIGLIPLPYQWISWWHSPTSDLNTTMALAVLVIVVVHSLGARRYRGGYLHHVFEYPALAPLTFIEEVSKLITLPFRLFGNIFAGEVLIIVFSTLLTGLATILLPFGQAFALALGLFIGAIQAFIFTVLSVAYISISSGGEGEVEHH